MTETTPLINKKVIVKLIDRPFMKIKNKDHLVSNGFHDDAKKYLTCPLNDNGKGYKKVLTDEEQSYFEELFALDKGAMSPYKREDNYWDTFEVCLEKKDNYLHLDKPEDFIKYKVLLANKMICPSLKELEENHKATYIFVIITEDEVNYQEKETYDLTSKAYKLLGKLEDNKDKLKVILEAIECKHFTNVSIDFLRNKINVILKNDNKNINTKLFIKYAEDKYLDHKVFIRKCLDNGVLANKGGLYYTIDTNQPLSDGNNESTLENAAIYLANPKHQDLYLKLKAKLEA